MAFLNEFDAEISRLRDELAIVKENNKVLMDLLMIYHPPFWEKHSHLLTGQKPPKPQGPAK